MRPFLRILEKDAAPRKRKEKKKNRTKGKKKGERGELYEPAFNRGGHDAKRIFITQSTLVFVAAS